jgi:hypothetical protein
MQPREIIIIKGLDVYEPVICLPFDEGKREKKGT